MHYPEVELGTGISLLSQRFKYFQGFLIIFIFIGLDSTIRWVSGGRVGNDPYQGGKQESGEKPLYPFGVSLHQGSSL